MSKEGKKKKDEYVTTERFDNAMASIAESFRSQQESINGVKSDNQKILETMSNVLVEV